MYTIYAIIIAVYFLTSIPFMCLQKGFSTTSIWMIILGGIGKALFGVAGILVALHIWPFLAIATPVALLSFIATMDYLTERNFLRVSIWLSVFIITFIMLVV